MKYEIAPPPPPRVREHIIENLCENFFGEPTTATEEVRNPAIARTLPINNSKYQTAVGDVYTVLIYNFLFVILLKNNQKLKTENRE